MSKLDSLNKLLMTSTSLPISKPDLQSSYGKSKKQRPANSSVPVASKVLKNEHNDLFGVKPRLPNLELTKKQHKLKLNTSHEMIRAMVSLEDEQDALRDKSNFAKSFKRMSAGMKLLEGSNQDKLLGIVAENIGLYDEKNLKEVTPAIKRPEVKWSNNSTSMWMKKHGFEGNYNGSNSFIKFLKNFFIALDENATGVISSSEFIVPLLSLGLSNDATYIEKALMSTFDCEDIRTIVMDKEAFVNFFKGDKKTDTILYSLDICCKTMLKEEEEKRVAQHVISKRSSMFYSQNTMMTERQIEKPYPTIEEFIRLVRKWWLDISHDSASINISRVADFLAEKGMAGNVHEGRAIAKNVESSSYFTYNSFEKIFLKPILKAALFNVAVVLTKGDFEEFSMKLKLAIVQRKLMMATTKYRHDSNAKQGRVTLQALDTYKKRVGIDTAKSNNAKMSKEAAEDLNEEKITQMLYKLKNNAKNFIDECGDIKQNIKNPWDIKSNLNESAEDYSPTPKFKEEKYLNTLFEPFSISLGSGPYDRRVKLFRENFLYKKFHNMVQMYPETKKTKTKFSL
ncbi:hypothetical protein SteCoe_17082 [Stentor coeruleus]|uniref:EF-hand domain-containing protein n=1 Tax=Stentor coeruleus TaxID=5963 RepID=A0A1R2BZM5_9CILI|nr:hypothetical protein SteCoe_17082 [Stentor coeruleus]